MQFRIAAALLLAASVAHAIVLGPELVVPSAPFGAATGHQWMPAIASAGPDSLAVWWDSDANAMFATVIAADGTVSIPSKRIYDGRVGEIALCWTGSMYIVTWSDGGATTPVLAMAVTRDGVPAGAPHLVAASARTSPGALAWNGRHALVTYRTATTRAAALLDEQANVLSTFNVPSSITDPIVRTDGSTFFAFWKTTETTITTQITPPPPSSSADTIHVARFSDAGAALAPSDTVVSRSPRVWGAWDAAFDGSRFALVFIGTSLRRVILDPQTLAASELPLLAANGLSGASVIWNGSAFVAVWPSYDLSWSLLTLPFTSAGGDATPSQIAQGAGAATNSAVAFNGRNAIALWIDHGLANGFGVVEGMVLDPSGRSAASTVFPVSSDRHPQTAPALAPGLVAWIERSAQGHADVVAAVAHSDGTFGPRIQVSASGKAASWPGPAMVFTGSTYLIAWREDASQSGPTQVFLRRLARDGTPLDAAPVFVANGFAPSLAFNGTTALLAFIGTNNSALRFDRDGNRLGDPVALRDGGSVALGVGTNGTDFLIAFTVGTNYWQAPSPNLRDVVGVRVSASGNVIDSVPFPIAATPADEGAPAVTASGGDYLVAYTSGADVQAQRVLRNGSLDGAPLHLGNGSDSQIAISADRWGAWIAWETAGVHLVRVIGTTVDEETIDGATTPAVSGATIAYARPDGATTSVAVRALPPPTRGHAAAH